jgi:hypothetical protein
MITVGKAIGSVVTRQTESSIFKPVAAQYGITVTQIPTWLRNVQFDRTGTILGERQRRVDIPNTMADVQLDTVEGLATFLVLILRFVQPAADIVEDIEDLLRGTYKIVNGGSLEFHQAQIVDGKICRQELPFSLRGILRTFTNSVIDADAQSPQRYQCIRFLAQLTNISASRSLKGASLKYAKFEHQRVLGFLLDPTTAGPHGSTSYLHTLSAGAAMIGLTAAANGADVLVECVRESGIIPINPSPRLSNATPGPRKVIRLWLIQPPTTILEDITADGIFQWESQEQDALTPWLAVYGGDLELSIHVAQHFHCNLTAEEILALWQAGNTAAQEATWTARRGFNTEVNLLYTDDFLECDIPIDLARMADKYFNAPRNDRRHKLSRKAASLLHACFNSSDYSSLSHGVLYSQLKLVMVSMFVGSLRSLVSNFTDKMSVYAWTADCEQLLGLMQRLVDGSHNAGLSTFHVTMQLAKIWGGLPPRHFETPRDDRGSVNSIVGIVCPQAIFLSNVLLDPVSVARNGLSKGLFSCYEGSSPMLPQDQDNGFIYAAGPRYSRPPVTIDLSTPNPMPDFHMDQLEGAEPTGPLIFSTEPSTIASGSMGLTLCVWSSGDLVMMLEPAMVMCGLLASRSLDTAVHTLKQRDIFKSRFLVAHLCTESLQWLECLLVVRGGFCIIDVGERSDWAVIAAGISAQSRVLHLMSAEDVAVAKNPQAVFEDGTIIITGELNSNPTSSNDVEERTEPSSVWAWYDIGYTKGPPKYQFGGVRF